MLLFATYTSRGRFIGQEIEEDRGPYTSLYVRSCPFQVQKTYIMISHAMRTMIVMYKGSCYQREREREREPSCFFGRLHRQVFVSFGLLQRKFEELDYTTVKEHKCEIVFNVNGFHESPSSSSLEESEIIFFIIWLVSSSDIRSSLLFDFAYASKNSLFSFSSSFHTVYNFTSV